MSTNTIRLHRVLRATPERIYRAFLDADAMAKWLPPNGFIGKVHHLDAKVGGTHKMSFTNFTTGRSHSFGGKYLELLPHERIRYTDKFDDPNLPGEVQVTVTSKWLATPGQCEIPLCCRLRGSFLLILDTEQQATASWTTRARGAEKESYWDPWKMAGNRDGSNSRRRRGKLSREKSSDRRRG